MMRRPRGRRERFLERPGVTTRQECPTVPLAGAGSDSSFIRPLEAGDNTRKRRYHSYSEQGECALSQHPLIDLANNREVKQATGFKKIAAELRGEKLAELYQQEIANAPRRADAGKKFFVGHNSKLASVRRPGRDAEHVSIALTANCRSAGDGLRLPDDQGVLQLVHALVPLKSAQPDKERGDDDPNLGVDRIDMLGVGPESRMAVVSVRFLAPDAKRVGVGDTPLRALLEGLANCAIASANREALQSEVTERGGAEMVDEPPILYVLGSKRYWELCRKREAQKGAVWIRELQRLATEIERDIGVTVRYLGFSLQGDPGWNYADGSPTLDGRPEITASWESTAGKVKPKPRPRAKKIDPADIIVEADLSRPVRRYAITEAFEAGDRIDHPTLGSGVVQGGAGRGKINVLFGEKRSLLVHERV